MPQWEGVTELQGLYGPLQVLEDKVQLVWALQMLQPGPWQTRSGRRLRVRQPGIWNRGAGPDFRDAVLEIDGEPVVGDVELHLYREDWWRHGHQHDRGYDRVVLHAVLFAGGMSPVAMTASGREPEEWVFGPWMREDIESVCGGEPGLFGEHVPEIREWMEAEAPQDIRQRLIFGAGRRWEQKLAMARCLMEAHGWEGGLHRMMLYHLGYPANRRAFFEMAELLEPEKWCEPLVLPFIDARWQKAVNWGLGRPANRPKRRLEQYQRLWACRPDWSRRLRCPPAGLLAAAMAGRRWATAATPSLRREARLPDWRLWLGQQVMGKVLSVGLCERLWSDVFLPGLVTDGILDAEAALGLWLHAYPVSCPDAYRPLLRICQVGSALYPVANGWLQGLIWLEDQMRLERVREALGLGTGLVDPSGA